MKYIVLIMQVSLLVLAMTACDKDDSGAPDMENNGYRVKKITGHNELWQNYTMEYAYQNERLDSAVIYHHDKSMKSILYVTYKTDLTEAEILDVVPMVDKDSMAKLDPDSIPYSMQTAMLVSFTLDKQYRIKSQHMEYWSPKKQDPHKDYEYRYEMKEQVNFLYEYAGEGGLLIWRSPNYLDAVRKVKCEYNWDGKNVSGTVLYYYEGGDWTPVQNEKFTYSGSHLMTWEEQNGIKAQYIWGGDQLEQVVFTGRGNNEIKYQYNGEGLVSKITRTNGDIEEISYEPGKGNFSWFSLQLEKIYQLPSGLGYLGVSSYTPFYER